MINILEWLGIKAIGGGVDFDSFMLGVKYDNEKGCVEDDPDAATLFIFLGPCWLLFILRG